MQRVGVFEKVRKREREREEDERKKNGNSWTVREKEGRKEDGQKK